MVHYDAKWKGITFMVGDVSRTFHEHRLSSQTSRQGAGVTGGTPLGFDVGAKRAGKTLPGLDLVSNVVATTFVRVLTVV